MGTWCYFFYNWNHNPYQHGLVNGFLCFFTLYQWSDMGPYLWKSSAEGAHPVAATLQVVGPLLITHQPIVYLYLLFTYKYVFIYILIIYIYVFIHDYNDSRH